MDISLKNITYNERLSEDTFCFSAVIYIDGKKAGTASNHGQGGPTSIDPRDLEDRIDAYAKTLPKIATDFTTKNHETGKEEPMFLDPDAEVLINQLLEQYLKRRDLQRLMRSKMVFTVADKPGIWTTKKLDAKYMAELYKDRPKTITTLKAVKVLNFLPEDEALAIYAAAHKP